MTYQTPEQYYATLGTPDPAAEAGGSTYRRGIIRSTPLAISDPTIGTDQFPGIPYSELPTCEHCGQRGVGHYYNCPKITGATVESAG